MYVPVKQEQNHMPQRYCFLIRKEDRLKPLKDDNWRLNDTLRPRGQLLLGKHVLAGGQDRYPCTAKYMK